MNISPISRAPDGVTPSPALMALISRHGRQKLEAFVAVAIDLFDTLDGDADSEESDVPEDDDPAATDLDAGEQDDADITLLASYAVDQSRPLERPNAVPDLPTVPINLRRS